MSFGVLGVWRAEKEFATHLAGNFLHLLDWFNNMNAWSESWLDEGTFSTTFSLNLGFHNESSLVIIAKLTPNCERFFTVECDVTSWNWNIVGAHKVRGLVLVETDVAQWCAYELSSYLGRF